MTLPRLMTAEKALTLLAFAAAAGAAVWWWRQQAPLRRLQAERVAPQISGAAYAPATLPGSVASAKPWGKPVAQSSGAGWIYELFTPPVIYYHETARTFTVMPPLHFAEQTSQPFGLELLAVKREPFRLQLVGYIGAPGDYTAAFVSEQSPQTLLARTGQRFDQLGLALKSFELRRIALDPRAAQPVYDVAAVATLHDERDGTEVTLDTRGPRLTNTPLAVLRVVTEAKGQPRVLHQGDTFQQDDATFRIEHIQLDPPEVVVAKHTAGLPYPETRVLKLEAAGRSTDAIATAKLFRSATAQPGVARGESRP